MCLHQIRAGSLKTEKMRAVKMAQLQLSRQIMEQLVQLCVVHYPQNFNEKATSECICEQVKSVSISSEQGRGE
jgi:hypothetical protein